MNPNDNNQNQQTPQQDNNGQQQGFVPYMAFPANMPREYDTNIYNMIADLVDKKYGTDIHPEARKFEIARVYSKLEIEMYEFSTFQLPKDKQEELQRMSENSQNNPGQQEDMVMKIRQYMQENVPNIQDMVNQYIMGFRNQYMAGRY